MSGWWSGSAFILGKVPLSGGLLLFFLIALFFTYLLAALSFGGVKALGPAWPPLRFLGMNYILIAFARDFILPVIHPKPEQYNLAHFVSYAPFAAMSIAAPLLVLAVTLRKSRLVDQANFGIGRVLAALCIAVAGIIAVQPLFWTLPAGYLRGSG